MRFAVRGASYQLGLSVVPDVEKCKHERAGVKYERFGCVALPFEKKRARSFMGTWAVALVASCGGSRMLHS